jgi:preprotein translocase subunit SecD
MRVFKIDGRKLGKDELEMVSRIIQTRLSILLDPDPEVSISEGDLLISAVEGEDTIVSIDASIEYGNYQFLDSDTQLEKGTIAPDDLHAIFTSENVSKAQAIETLQGEWQVHIDLDVEGTEQLAEFSMQNFYHYLVTVKDSLVISSARAVVPITNGRFVIVGLDQFTSMKIAAQLESGSLPFQLAMEEEP